MITIRSRFGKGRIAKPRAMNKLESAYSDLLEARKRLGEIRDFGYETLTLKLGPDCRYTPDFFVMAADDVIECHECKGPKQWDDAMVKLRSASARFPFRFFLCKRTGGEWNITAVAP